jgi:hypothetical protein
MNDIINQYNSDSRNMSTKHQKASSAPVNIQASPETMQGKFADLFNIQLTDDTIVLTFGKVVEGNRDYQAIAHSRIIMTHKGFEVFKKLIKNDSKDKSQTKKDK